ncbi:endolytic transglycosylase MltG [Alicyclobacillus acidocaldarius]|uniref:Endolytic murein transglycosylase n=1 Tax=Alicyclobacillus acidocaldarius (strain Tc-4-1) TaxID=1048834 RepID=F8IF80_ALIAT|nr:endolytic transglycosylase MltG [Alicyclobacillus acidocaldarius]AEJ44045.1 aminodeoxychorismate lyase [Alicyclobacillus acidocaldarius subsp. acidocaldarius Tc-4-1]
MSNQPASARRRARWMILVALALVVVVALVFGAWFRAALRPVSAKAPLERFKVKAGDTVATVAERLKAMRLIRSATAFELYGRLSGGRPILAGTYALSADESAPQIYRQMTAGEIVPDVVNVTIPPGYDVVDIAARLAQDGVCSEAAFLKAVQADNYHQAFLKQLAGRRDVRYRLEGYLFPDTYQFYRNENPVDVVNEMLNDFAARVLTSANEAAMRADKLTLNETITEASLIENEAQVPSERPIIASVIDNRLKLRMRLQIDATVDYAIGRHLTVVTDADILDARNPYNTYLYGGLPPGPICSPSLASIEAVLHPAHTKYLYYVAKGNGTGEHYFAETYSQQLHNEMLREENLKKRSEQSSGK